MDFIDEDGFFTPVSKASPSATTNVAKTNFAQQKPLPNPSKEYQENSNSENPYVFSTIIDLIHQGEEPYAIFYEIAQAATMLPGINGSGLFLYDEKNIKQVETVARFGNIEGKEYESLMESPDCYIADIMSLGAVQGVLICSYESLHVKTQASLEMLGHHASVVYERQRLSKNLQHFLDRIQTLNELYKIIATCQDRKSILKKLVKEAALRFSSDVSLIYTWNEEQKQLEVQNGYGCSSSNVLTTINKNSTLLWEVASKGGFLSFAPNKSTSDAEWLKNLGLQTVICAPLDVPGEKIGIIVIGFQNELLVTKTEVTGVKEFCAGAATAIYNATNQERVQNYAQNLETLVEERTKELAIQTKKAEEANVAKSRFLANMSHELRTPLTAIVGYSSVMEDGLYGEMNPKQIEALSSIVKSSDHLKSLIDDILNLAKIESGKEEPQAINLSLEELLVNSQKLIAQLAANKQIQIPVCNLDPEIKELDLYLDKKHSRQILYNLLSNAVKYTPAGGKVWITTEKINNEFIAINIHDTGVGISEERLTKLFDRFERGDDQYSREQEGTGIGLNLTQKLAEINGGKLTVRSQIGKGSVFTVELPIYNSSLNNIEEASVNTQMPNDVKQNLEGITALIVDNNNDTCAILKNYLESKGAKVNIEKTVKEGLNNVKNSSPDIILTDLAFKGEDGVKLIQEIRSTKNESSKVPIIAISACAFDSDKKTAEDAGASYFIAKPFNPNDVVKEILKLTKNSLN